MSEQKDYKVSLDSFTGPLDLLLYLIRRDEVDIWNIPIAQITDQYLKYVEMMGDLNIAFAGEFIVMAATLIEIKSRMLAPQPVQGEEEEGDDPRMELVRQLMEYRKFKEAALALNDCATQQAERFNRSGEKPEGAQSSAPSAPAGVTIWALLDAFSKILQQTGASHKIVFDQIPQEVIKAKLEERLRTAGKLSFFALFDERRDRIWIVGTFLALLELVKQQVLRVEQETVFGDIAISFIPPEERAPEPAETELPIQVAQEPQSDAEEEPEESDDEWPDMPLPDIPDVAPAEPAPASDTPDKDASEEDVEDEEDEFDEDEDEYDDDEDEYDDEDDDEDEEDGEEEESE